MSYNQDNTTAFKIIAHKLLNNLHITRESKQVRKNNAAAIFRLSLTNPNIFSPLFVGLEILCCQKLRNILRCHALLGFDNHFININ